MARDKIYGAIILIVAVLIILWYSWWTLYFGVYIGSQVDNGATQAQFLLAFYPDPTKPNLSVLFGFNTLMLMQYWFSTPSILSWILVPPRYLAVAIPIWLAVTLILVIAAWIGYTMLTTPPPVPLEELEKAEGEGEEAKEKKAKAKKKK